jgi:hypothetical protein
LTTVIGQVAQQSAEPQLNDLVGARTGGADLVFGLSVRRGYAGPSQGVVKLIETDIASCRG